MNPEQKSLTLAFIVVFGSITVRNNWYARFKTFLTSSPKDAAKNAPVTTKPQYGLQNWQAAVASYIILMVLAETPASPVVAPIAWGVALIQLATAFNGSNSIQSQYPQVFGGQTNPTPSTATLPEGNLVGA